MVGQGKPRAVAESVREPCDPVGAAVVLIEGGHGTVSGWTCGAQCLLGYHASEVVGRRFTELVAGPREWQQAPAGRPTDPAGEAESSGEAPQEVRALEFEPGVLDLRHRDGRITRFQARAVPLHDGTDDARWMVFLGAEHPTATTTRVSPGVRGTPGAHEGGTGTDAATGAGAGTGNGAAEAFPFGPFGHAVLQNSPVGLAVWDTDLRCRWLNTTQGHEHGPFRHRRVGRTMREALYGFDPELVEGAMRQVLRDGRPVIDHEFRRATDDGAEEVTSSTLFRLDDADGTPLGVGSFAVDITRSRSRERLTLLSEVGVRIGTTLDVITTAQELADVAVPLLADFATVDLAESVRLGGEPLEHLRPHSTVIPAFRRAAVASVNEGAPESAFEVGEVIYVPKGSPLLEVVHTREPLYQPIMDASANTWFIRDPVRAQRVSHFAMHSMIVLPLEARRTVLGVAVFIRSTDRPAFTQDDLELAQELTVRAALHLDNARRYTRERRAALALQRNLLPRSLRGSDAVELAAEYVPADGDEAMGGDWFDCVHLSGGRVGLVVGDVVGHGMEAAATMGRMRTAAYALALLDLPPAELLTRFDRAALNMSDENRGVDGFARPLVAGSCVYAEYDPATGNCTVSVAGNLPPFLVSPDGHSRQLDLPVGTPIGVGEGGYEEVTVSVDDGSIIALFTDGIVNGLMNAKEGIARLKENLARPSADLAEYCREVAHAAVPGNHRDDATLLVARVRRTTGAPDPTNPGRVVPVPFGG